MSGTHRAISFFPWPHSIFRFVSFWFRKSLGKSCRDLFDSSCLYYGSSVLKKCSLHLLKFKFMPGPWAHILWKRELQRERKIENQSGEYVQMCAWSPRMSWNLNFKGPDCVFPGSVILVFSSPRVISLCLWPLWRLSRSAEWEVKSRTGIGFSAIVHTYT